MSKERLEEIVKQVKRSDEYAEKGLWAVSDKKIVNLHNEGHINYLIERVQELEGEIKVYESENRSLAKEREALRQRVQELEDKIVSFEVWHMLYEQLNKRYREILEEVRQNLIGHYGLGGERDDYVRWSKELIDKELEGSE